MVVEKRGSQWCTIHCHGEKAGTPIACFPTKEAADRQHRAIEASEHIDKIEIDLAKLQKEEPLKAWQVLFADGRAVQYFEDESDADHFVDTSKSKSWFCFIHNKYVEVPKRKRLGRRYNVNPRGTRITFEQSNKD